MHKTPVTDTFTVVEPVETTVKWAFLPLESRFYDFGAGMASQLNAGETMSLEDGAIVIRGFSHTLPQLNYIVGTVSDHWLYIKGQKLSLRDMCGKNAHVEFIIGE